MEIQENKAMDWKVNVTREERVMEIGWRAGFDVTASF
jgi:hypothetical protein